MSLHPSLLFVLSLALLTGCASVPEENGQMQQMTTRVGDLERAFGQQAVRLDSLEDRLDLLYDKVETNRLALERGGMSRSLPLAGLAEAPMPYAEPAPLAPLPGQEIPELEVVRIEVPDGVTREQTTGAAAAPVDGELSLGEAAPEASEGKIVITEKDYQDFVGVEEPTRSVSSGGGSKAPVARRTGGKRSPYEDVTQERLPSAAAPLPVETSQEKLSPMETYKRGLALYREGQYAEAIVHFKNYLSSQPEADYIDNAYYWLGECKYGMGEYIQSLEYFTRVMRETPQGNKVPDSMLKASLAHFQMGDKERAKQMIEKLIEIYPRTNAAKVASTRLKTLSF